MASASAAETLNRAAYLKALQTGTRKGPYAGLTETQRGEVEAEFDAKFADQTL